LLGQGWKAMSYRNLVGKIISSARGRVSRELRRSSFAREARRLTEVVAINAVARMSDKSGPHCMLFYLAKEAAKLPYHIF